MDYKTEEGTKKYIDNLQCDYIIQIRDAEYFSDGIVKKFADFLEIVCEKCIGGKNSFTVHTISNKRNFSSKVIRNCIYDFNKWII